MREESKYYKKTYNNVWTTYCMLGVKLPALTQFNVESLGQSDEAGMKPTVDGLIISHFRWYSMSSLYGSKLKTGSSKLLYSKPDFGHTRCLRGRHWWRNAGRSYSKFLLLLLGRVNEVWCQLQYHHQTRANFVTYGTSTNNGDSDGNSNSDSDGSSDSDSDGSNEGDGAKKTCIQDEPGMLVNHEITTK